MAGRIFSWEKQFLNLRYHDAKSKGILLRGKLRKRWTILNQRYQQPFGRGFASGSRGGSKESALCKGRWEACELGLVSACKPGTLGLSSSTCMLLYFFKIENVCLAFFQLFR